MGKIIFNTDFSNIPAFADEVRQAFENSIPPIVFSVDSRESLLLFSQEFSTDKPGMGRRVSCKRASNGSSLNFSPREIFKFSDEQYPLIFSFKNIRDVEDFANGWSRLQEAFVAEEKEAAIASLQKAEEEKIRVEKEIEEEKRQAEKEAKVEELKNQIHKTQERLALIAEKFLDGELSKEEKTQLTERYSAQIMELRSQINEISPNSGEKPSIIDTKDLKKEREMVTRETPKVEQNNDGKKKSSVGKIIIGIIAAIIAIYAISAAVGAIRQANYERERQERLEYERTHPSNYKKLLDALESGKVRYGMTYRQIADMVGEASSVSRSGGEIQFAYYYKSSAYSSYDATSIQLCFRNGRLYNWND